MPFRTGASRLLCIRQTLRFKRLIARLEWAMELPILQSFAHSIFAHRGAFKDHGKPCAARLGRQFVELSEEEIVRMGEFTRLSAKAPVAQRDYPHF
jgi:hypothetical protein